MAHTDLCPASLGSTPAGTNVSHWWWQDEHSAKIARVPVKDLRHVQAFEQ